MRNIQYRQARYSTFSRQAEMSRMRQVIREELTELQRYTVMAYYFQEQTLQQIADHRNVNKSTVWRTLRRAEEKLKKYLTY